MSVQELEQAVSNLPEAELRAFADWLEEYVSNRCRLSRVDGFRHPLYTSFGEMGLPSRTHGHTVFHTRLPQF